MNKIVKKIIITIISICLIISLIGGIKIGMNKIFTKNYPEKIMKFPLQINSFLNIYEPYVVNYNYGNYYFQKEMYDKAYEKYEKALSYDIPIDRVCLVKYNTSVALTKMADASSNFEKIELLKKAQGYLQECIKMDYNFKDQYLVAKILLVVIFTMGISLIVMAIVGKRNGKLIPPINREYMHSLEILLNEVKEEEIDSRDAYKKMSSIIRKFIAKVTKINVLNLSKSEINKLEIKDLSLLMDEYYKNEFSKNSQGDIIDSINRTMEVIRTWNWK